MNRRAFLARLGFGTVAAAAAATGVIDIERLLWTPGEKTIFLPSVEVVDFAMCDWFTRESLQVLQNKLALTAAFNRDYDDFFAVGQTIRVRAPRRFH